MSSCFLCLSPLVHGVMRILECPDHWVHDHCYTHPLNPAAIRCPVCSKQGTAVANGFMYNEQKHPCHQEACASDSIPVAKRIKTEPLGYPRESGVQLVEEASDAVYKSEAFEPLDGNLPDCSVSSSDGTSPRQLIPNGVGITIKKSSQTHGQTLIVEHWDPNEDDHYFSCAACGARYTTKYATKVHIRTRHQERLTKPEPEPYAHNHSVKEPNVLKFPDASDLDQRFHGEEKSWTKAKDLFTLRDHRKQVYTKICVFCCPPKIIGFNQEKVLFEEHVMDSHMGDDGRIHCPFCSNSSPLPAVRALEDHIKFEHLKV